MISCIFNPFLLFFLGKKPFYRLDWRQCEKKFVDYFRYTHRGSSFWQAHFQEDSWQGIIFPMEI